MYPREGSSRTVARVAAHKTRRPTNVDLLVKCRRAQRPSPRIYLPLLLGNCNVLLTEMCNACRKNTPSPDDFLGGELGKINTLFCGIVFIYNRTTFFYNKCLSIIPPIQRIKNHLSLLSCSALPLENSWRSPAGSDPADIVCVVSEGISIPKRLRSIVQEPRRS